MAALRLRRLCRQTEDCRASRHSGIRSQVGACGECCALATVPMYKKGPALEPFVVWSETWSCFSLLTMLGQQQHVGVLFEMFLAESRVTTTQPKIEGPAGRPRSRRRVTRVQFSEEVASGASAHQETTPCWNVNMVVSRRGFEESRDRWEMATHRLAKCGPEMRLEFDERLALAVEHVAGVGRRTNLQICARFDRNW